RSISQQEFLVRSQRWRRVSAAFIPHQHRPAARFENADELPTCSRLIEPVRRLRCRYEIETVIGKSGGLGFSRHAVEPRISCQVLLSGLAHLGVGLDPVNLVAVLEQQSGEEAGAERNVGY